MSPEVLGGVLLGLGIVLLLADIFLATDFMSFFGWGAFAIGVAVFVPFGAIAAVALGLAVFTIGGVLHVSVLRGLGERACDRVASDRYRAGAEGLAGKRGKIRIVEGRVFVEINEDLWPLERGADLSDGTMVDLFEAPDGSLQIRTSQEGGA